jgi:hypothetical protein
MAGFKVGLGSQWSRGGAPTSVRPQEGRRQSAASSRGRNRVARSRFTGAGPFSVRVNAEARLVELIGTAGGNDVVCATYILYGGMEQEAEEEAEDIELGRILAGVEFWPESDTAPLPLLVSDSSGEFTVLATSMDNDLGLLTAEFTELQPGTYLLAVEPA